MPYAQNNGEEKRPERMGLSLIDKPAGLGSHDLVSLIRKTLGMRRVGHIGTLDPMAEGLMGVLIGRATLLSPYLILEDKEYTGEIILGLRTDSDDITGNVIEDLRDLAPLDISPILEAIHGLLGTKPQIPPSFSAISKGGVRSYKRARGGEKFTLPPRMVTLKSFDALSYVPPVLGFRALVSKGFYIRALARDLGLLLGLPGGTLKSLKRLSLGPFSIKDAIRPPFGPEELYASLIPPEKALPFLPEYPLSHRETELIRCGGFTPLNPSLLKPYPPLPQGPVKLTGPSGELVALGRISFEKPGQGIGRGKGREKGSEKGSARGEGEGPDNKKGQDKVQDNAQAFAETATKGKAKTATKAAAKDDPSLPSLNGDLIGPRSYGPERSPKNPIIREGAGFSGASGARAVDFSLSSRYKSEAPETNKASGKTPGGAPGDSPGQTPFQTPGFGPGFPKTPLGGAGPTRPGPAETTLIAGGEANSALGRENDALSEKRDFLTTPEGPFLRSLRVL